MTAVRRGDLTWGQAELVDWTIINAFPLSASISLRDLAPEQGVPGRDMAEAALSALVARHAALRTKVVIPREAPGYMLGPAERPTQFVDDDAGFVLRWCDDGVYSAAEFMTGIDEGYLSGTSTLDPGRDPTLGLVYPRSSGGFGCLLVTSHLVTDGAGCRRLSQEYQALVAGADPARLPPAADPLAVAAVEAEPARQETSCRNVAWARRLLRETPEHLLVRPRDVEASTTTTSSPSFAAHVSLLSRRFGIPAGGIVTTLASLLQWQDHGHSPVLVRALTQVPPPVRGSSYIGPNALPALSAVPVRPEWTLRELFARAWASIVESYRRGIYDPAAFDRMQHELAVPLGRELLDGLLSLNFHIVPDTEARSREAELDHRRLERHDAVFRTLLDIAYAGTSMTVHMRGSTWPGTGDTRGQIKALLNLAAAIATQTDDEATVNDVTGGPGCNRW